MSQWVCLDCNAPVEEGVFCKGCLSVRKRAARWAADGPIVERFNMIPFLVGQWNSDQVGMFPGSASFLPVGGLDTSPSWREARPEELIPCPSGLLRRMDRFTRELGRRVKPQIDREFLEWEAEQEASRS